MYEIVEPVCEFRALDIKSQQDVIESISVKASCQGKTMHATSNFSNRKAISRSACVTWKSALW